MERNYTAEDISSGLMFWFKNKGEYINAYELEGLMYLLYTDYIEKFNEEPWQGDFDITDMFCYSTYVKNTYGTYAATEINFEWTLNILRKKKLHSMTCKEMLRSPLPYSNTDPIIGYVNNLMTMFFHKYKGKKYSWNHMAVKRHKSL